MMSWSRVSGGARPSSLGHTCSSLGVDVLERAPAGLADDAHQVNDGCHSVAGPRQRAGVRNLTRMNFDPAA